MDISNGNELPLISFNIERHNCGSSVDGIISVDVDAYGIISVDVDAGGNGIISVDVDCWIESIDSVGDWIKSLDVELDVDGDWISSIDDPFLFLGFDALCFLFLVKGFFLRIAWEKNRCHIIAKANKTMPINKHRYKLVRQL